MNLMVSAEPMLLAETLEKLQRLWDLELLGIKKTEEVLLTKEEFEAQRLQDQVTHYDPQQKTWVTSLLFKERPPKVGSNKKKALGILQKVEKSTIQKGVVDEVNVAYEEYVTKGYSEEVLEDYEPAEVHYLPAHAVFKDSASMKTRIVFNASAISETGKSLNQCLYQGQCLLPDITHVLLRFRLKIVGFAMDISRMFLQVKLEEGMDYLRYFWRNCQTEDQIRTFRMTSLTFGVISSPFQAIDVVLKHAELFEKIYPRAVQVIREQLYMDDVLGGAVDLETAKATIKEIMAFFFEASMQPHKFASNYREALQCVPEEFCSPEGVQKVLGVLWDTESDKLRVNVKDFDSEKKSDTKRSFLESSAKIYDPNGWIAPFTLKMKLLFQQVWLEEQKEARVSNSWDKPLPNLIQEQWDEIKKDIPNLETVEVPRCPFVMQGPPEKMEIFAFGDASQRAYAAAIYLVGTHADGSKSSHLALAKTRVAPMKMAQCAGDYQTIVRLELLAALITARAAAHVKKGIERVTKVTGVHFFTDSLINLCRIRKGPSKYRLWVANRIEDILKLSSPDDWHHCPGMMNPADLPSRGLTVEELKSSTLWWNGPDFIRNDKASWPTEAEVHIKEDPEQRKIVELDEGDWKISVAFTSNAQEEEQWIAPNWDFICSLMSRFEDWHKTVKMFACILKLSVCMHKKFWKKSFSTEERRATEKFLWKLTQKHHFETEHRCLTKGLGVTVKSGLAAYNPFLAKEEGLIRSNTRLSLSNLPEATRQAIILPKDCPIVMKFVLHKHKLHQHAGTSYLHALLKEEFLIPRGRQQIRKIIRTCLGRRCVKPVPLGQQEAPLPALRVNDPAPFQSVAVDLFGPMMVFHDCGIDNCPHPREAKVHCALFTCFQSRAVHLELVDDTGTEAFLNAFREFVARRGTPSTVYSDNAKGFKAASREVRQLYRSINWAKVRQDGVTRMVEWFFSTERSPHQNGLCERLVRTVKTPLRVVVGSAKLTRNQLALILHEIEAVVNNRPLATTTEDPSDWVPITPMELVNGRRLEQIPDPKSPKASTSFSHLWKRRQAILNQFWKRWSHDYLLEQSVRRIWRTPKFDDLMGKVVLIKDDHLSRNEWMIGRIVEIIPSKDGLVRNVVVKTATSRLRRAVQKLALFEQI